MRLISLALVFLTSVTAATIQRNCKYKLEKTLYSVLKNSRKFKSSIHTECENPDYIALTYDDGVSEFTPMLLEILKKYRVKATFFILGESLENEDNIQILRKMLCDGHVIAAHTWDRPDLTKLSEEDIVWQLKRSEKFFLKAIGVKPSLFRPPYGPRVEQILHRAGHEIVMWSKDTNDWRTGGRNISISDDAHLGGAIILQHDIFLETVIQQERIIKHLLKNNSGKEFVTISKCLNLPAYKL